MPNYDFKKIEKKQTGKYDGFSLSKRVIYLTASMNRKIKTPYVEIAVDKEFNAIMLSFTDDDREYKMLTSHGIYRICCVGVAKKMPEGKYLLAEDTKDGLIFLFAQRKKKLKKLNKKVMEKETVEELKEEKHFKIVLGEMCKRVGANAGSIDFTEPKWFAKYTWTETEQKDFTEWLKIYMKNNKEARHEMMKSPSLTQDKYLEKFANNFVANYGWVCEEK